MLQVELQNMVEFNYILSMTETILQFVNTLLTPSISLKQ